MTSQHLRRRLLKAMRNMTASSIGENVIHFYFSVFELYTRAAPNDRISMDNMTLEEKEIVRAFANTRQVSGNILEIQSVTEIYELRKVLTGIVYCRIEIYPILITLADCENLKRMHFRTIKHVARAEHHLQQLISCEQFAEGRDQLTIDEIPYGHLWWDNEFVYEDLDFEDPLQYEMEYVYEGIYDAEYLLTD